jgi:predicted membrane channel-forming protein YqfA (hemolysin III family)
MGICQGALGSPYFMARLLRISDWNDNVFKIYVYILLTLYCICMFFFGYLLITNSKNSCIKKISIYNLLILATFGNAPLICIGLNNSFPITIRMYCLCGPISLTLGYIIYLYNIPEMFLKEGVSDGKIWNSHVIWHNFVTISQICFCSCAITNIY